jgi:hypothetical protein
VSVPDAWHIPAEVDSSEEEEASKFRGLPSLERDTPVGGMEGNGSVDALRFRVAIFCVLRFYFGF